MALDQLLEQLLRLQAGIELHIGMDPSNNIIADWFHMRSGQLWLARDWPKLAQVTKC